MRECIARAAARSQRLREIRKELEKEYCIEDGKLPQPDDLRELFSKASKLEALDMTSKTIRNKARTLREFVDRSKHVNDTLTRLKSLFGIDESLADIDEMIEMAIRALNDIDTDLLSSRIDSLIDRHAGRILARAEREVKDLKQLRDDLSQRFDLGSLPASDELRQAIRSLNALHGPVILNRSARRAMTLHRTLALSRDKPSAITAADELRELAEYLAKVSQLEEDAETAECLGPYWHGLDSDFTTARRIADWAADVNNQFAGLRVGRAEIRETLLRGEFDRLA